MTPAVLDGARPGLCGGAGGLLPRRIIPNGEREGAGSALSGRLPPIAVGFGAELLALCDVVIMAEGAFLSDPHVTYGLRPSPACQLVWPHLTSVAVAKELLMSGRRVEASEALRLGLVNRITAR